MTIQYYNVFSATFHTYQYKKIKNYKPTMIILLLFCKIKNLVFYNLQFITKLGIWNRSVIINLIKSYRNTNFRVELYLLF